MTDVDDSHRESERHAEEPRRYQADRNARNDAHRDRTLVAGVGNVLRGDDGFGPAVIHALEAAGALPDGTRAVEVGIGGIRLVHELMDGWDALVIVDAVDRGGEPGTLYVLEPEPLEPAALSDAERRVLASDMHQLVPGRVLAMASALEVLPTRIRIVGCQPERTDEMSIELSPAVARAVPKAVERIRAIAAGGSRGTATDREEAAHGG